MKAWKTATCPARGWVVNDRFNGATPMKAWKTSVEATRLRASPQLQWSHADEGVEDPADTPIAAVALPTLQWSHADEGVEDTTPGGPP